MKERNTYYPLGDAQKVIKTGEQFSIERKKVKESSFIEFYITSNTATDNDTEFKAFSNALNSVIKNNDALRIRMKRTVLGLRQYVSEYKPYNLKKIILKDESAFEEFLNNTSRIQIKWTDNDMFRAFFIQYSTDKNAFFLRIHHTIFDGYSVRLFFEQLKKAYFAYKAGDPIDDIAKPSVIDVYKNIEEYKKSTKYVKDKKFWKNKFYNQRDYSMPAGKRSEFGDCDSILYRLEGQNYNKLIGLSTELKCSHELVVMSALAIGILALTGKDNFCLQSISHGRQKASQLMTMGSIQNDVPIFYDIDIKKNASEFIKESNINYLESLSHARFPQNAMIPLSYKESIRNGWNFNHGWLLFSSMEFGMLAVDESFKLKMRPRRHQPFQLYVTMLETKCSYTNFILSYQTRKYNKEECEHFMDFCIKTLLKLCDNPNATIEELI